MYECRRVHSDPADHLSHFALWIPSLYSLLVYLGHVRLSGNECMGKNLIELGLVPDPGIG